MMNLLFWIGTIVLLAIALTAAILALTLRRPRVVIVSAGALVAAFVTTSLASGAVPGWVSVLVALFGLALATAGGGPVVDTTLDLATPGQRQGSHGGILLTRPVPTQPNPAPAATGPAATTPAPSTAAPSTAAPSTAAPSTPAPSTPAPSTATPTAAAATGPAAIGQPIEVLRGGTTIGVLERIAAAGSIMTGAAEAIAVVIAIKGLGRFTELSSPEARERFIIGTLASLLWAGACGTLARIYLG